MYLRARWKGLSAKIVLSLRHMLICAFGLLSNPVKFPKLQYMAPSKNVSVELTFLRRRINVCKNGFCKNLNGPKISNGYLFLLLKQVINLLAAYISNVA
jgi:hypothetical protein